MRAASIPARLPARSLGSKRLLALAGDETLVAQIRRGNEVAFEVAFERYGGGILGFCRHMLGSPEEAEDAVQHTFAAAFRDLQRGGEHELALRPWLYAIARNRCVSMLRARRERAAEAVEPVATTGLAEEVERRAELRALLRDLRELPEDQRSALLLAEVGDLSHAEVARVLECEVHRVKALVFRARSGLIQRRQARETPCEQIREQLANLRGGSLRRSGLRHHLRECRACRAYREQVMQQRRMLALALPVAPSLGLKSSVLAAIGLGGGGSAGGIAAGLAGAGAASAPFGTATLAKIAALGVLAGGGTVAGKSALDASEPQRPARPPVAAKAQAHSGGTAQSAAGATGGENRETSAAIRKERGAWGERRRREHASRREEPRSTRAGAHGRDKPKAVPRGSIAVRGGRRLGHQRIAAKAKPEPRGRGPVAAPPPSPPVKRGPPGPPKADRPPKLELRAAPPVAIKAPKPHLVPQASGPRK